MSTTTKGARRRGRPGFKSGIARRIQALLPFACPNLRLLSEKELRSLERHLWGLNEREGRA